MGRDQSAVSGGECHAGGREAAPKKAQDSFPSAARLGSLVPSHLLRVLAQTMHLYGLGLTCVEVLEISSRCRVPSEQDGCDVEEDGDGRLAPGGVPQNEINGEGKQFNYAAMSEREDQDGDCLAFLCLPVIMNREM